MLMLPMLFTSIITYMRRIKTQVNPSEDVSDTYSLDNCVGIIFQHRTQLLSKTMQQMHLEQVIPLLALIKETKDFRTNRRRPRLPQAHLEPPLRSITGGPYQLRLPDVPGELTVYQSYQSYQLSVLAVVPADFTSRTH